MPTIQRDRDGKFRAIQFPIFIEEMEDGTSAVANRNDPDAIQAYRLWEHAVCSVMIQNPGETIDPRYVVVTNSKGEQLLAVSFRAGTVGVQTMYIDVFKEDGWKAILEEKNWDKFLFQYISPVAIKPEILSSMLKMVQSQGERAKERSEYRRSHPRTETAEELNRREKLEKF